MRRRLITIALSFTTLHSLAQQPLDSVAAKELNEVVVTATRNERKLSSVAVPVTIISQKQIQQAGSLRLNDILQEQTGLQITAGTGSNAVGGGVFGNGIQIQGLSPDYTIVLLDGEPLIGRQGGVLDLSRFSVGNIKKIEVIKGPSSSLYGSEAMGGVVNIITEPVGKKQLNTQIRYGSFNTTDIAASGNFNHKKSGLYFFANRNGSNGYKLNNAVPEKTVDPYYNYTGQLKWQYRISNKTRFTINNRYYYSSQKSYYALNSPKINVGGEGRTTDLNIHAQLTHQFSATIKSSLRLYASNYGFIQSLDSISNGKTHYYDRFFQDFYRAENQTDIHTGNNNTLTLGAGYTGQTVRTNRYAGKKQQSIAHVFVQDEWQPLKNLTIIAGVRYDDNASYANRVSPKLAAQWKISDRVKINASYGAGFKAPDFRQLYLNLNNVSEGYTLYGATEFSVSFLEQQKLAGIIAEILPAAFSIKELTPETSRGLNIGTHYQIGNAFKAELNLFRNDIDNLINYIPVAKKTNGSNVFSYLNVNRAYTQGIETNMQYLITPSISISGGYQFLQSADKNILQSIKNKLVYGRAEIGGAATIISTSDYSGLLNRSKHMANLRFFYDNSRNGWSASLRFSYRSKWGIGDNDGNGFANNPAEFARGFVQANTTVSKKIKQHWFVQAGINNLFNYTDYKYLPNLPGVNFFTSISYSLNNK
jgi:outer membrane receptor for ferrienterochelin and colicins